MDRRELILKKSMVSMDKVACMTGKFYRSLRENEVTLIEANMIVQELNNLLKIAEKRPGHTKLSEIPKTDVFGINTDILEENDPDQEGSKAIRPETEVTSEEERFRKILEEYQKRPARIHFPEEGGSQKHEET